MCVFVRFVRLFFSAFSALRRSRRQVTLPLNELGYPDLWRVTSAPPAVGSRLPSSAGARLSASTGDAGSDATKDGGSAAASVGKHCGLCGASLEGLRRR